MYTIEKKECKDFKMVAIPPDGITSQSIVIAAIQAGAFGVIDLEYVRDTQAALSAIRNVVAHTSGALGIKIDGYAFTFWSKILPEIAKQINSVIITYSNPESLKTQVELLHKQCLSVILEITSLEEASLGEQAGVDILITKGSEAGGRVGEETTFILLQRIVRHISLPIWAHGGIGLHTAGACYAAGAAGVVLDWQLALLRESPLQDEIKAWIKQMDGTEPVCVGQTLGQSYRMCARPGLPVIAELQEQEMNLASIEDRNKQLAQWKEIVVNKVATGPSNGLLLIGQDIALAHMFAKRFRTVAAVLDGINSSLISHCETAKKLIPLRKDSPLAKVHATKYPIVQGPMNRVSDIPSFATAVAEEGGLPFIALGMMTVDEIEPILKQTKTTLGDKPWGVGFLGFISEALLKRQIEIVQKIKPRFSLIAGGRPAQARALEAEGITTYLHVPSPRLLRIYLEEGIKHFIFEGRESGGHVGPLNSFVLWETSIEILLEMIPANSKADEYRVLFAGGINDALSSVMVGILSALLADRGVGIGIQVGTSYLFTKEAVETGAICKSFQEALLHTKETVVLDSGGGHAIRCINSNFTRTFGNEKRRLQIEGVKSEKMRIALEQLSVGKLRIAAKGIAFNPECLKDPNAPITFVVSEQTQKNEGLYMAGQTVALNDERFSIRQLHENLCLQGSERLLNLAATYGDTGLKFQKQRSGKIAIIGMSCVLPKAKDLKTYWGNIINKVNAITEIPAERWDWHQYYDPDPKKKDKIYSKWGGFIDPITFEPTDYGMPPNSMESIDPMQILALEAVRAAIRDAGYIEREFDREHTSVIFGASGGLGDYSSLYAIRSLMPLLVQDMPLEILNQLPEWTEDSFPGLLLNVISGRIANNFNFGGVNFSVDAACASSLAAVYHAVRELTIGSSNMVVVGGIDTALSPFSYLCFSKTQALSPTGQGRTFDASADGIVISEGVAVLVLKRLEDAQRDGDRIYALIDGISGASDGKGKSLTAPLPEGQARTLYRAYKSAGVSVSDVELIEAHGTGTVAGDRAEATSLDMVLRSANALPKSCAVGSVKSMIGHTKATAGIAGLIKVALSLYHKVLPPTIGVKTPNPHTIFDNNGPLYVNTQARPWINSRGPCRAGVSAFGFGGTNFHAVLEEHREDDTISPSCVLETLPSEIFFWQGTSIEELLKSIEPLEHALERGAQPNLRDLAYTIDLNAIQYAKEKVSGAVRLAIVAESIDDLKDKLAKARYELSQNPQSINNLRGVYYSAKPLAKDGKIALLFPGQGSQRPDMLRDLTILFPEMKQCFSKADQVLGGRLPKRLSEYIFPNPGFTPEEEKVHLDELTNTDIAQPALAATEMGLLAVLKSFGIAAHMVAGHSSGEYAALAAAGVFTQETLYEILHYRGTAILEMESKDLGTMLAVMANSDDIKAVINDLPDVYMANFNSPVQTVLSGSKEVLQEVKSRFNSSGITCQFIPVNCAFHSPYMNQARDRLAQKISDIKFNKPDISLYSNLLARPYPANKEEIVSCLSDHLVSPVLFRQEIEAMFDDGARIFVEVGPRSVLTNLVKEILLAKPHLAIACNSSSSQHDITQLQHMLAQLLSEGVDVNLDPLFKGRKVKKLNLNSLNKDSDKPALRPTTWMVAGNCAWPANKPRPVIKQISWEKPVGMEFKKMEDLSGNPTAAEVMIRHQKLMMLFLEQQKELMSCFLQGKVGALPKQPPTVPQESVLPINEYAVTPVKEETMPQEKEKAPTPVENIGKADIEQLLVNLTSERTGYPPEMLGLDLNMEADLGIDSIKRVEIISVFVKNLPNAPSDFADKLITVKTLRNIIDKAIEVCKGPDTVTGKAQEVPRCLFSLVDHQLDKSSKIIFPEGVIIITDDAGGYAEQFQAKIKELGGAAVIVRLANTAKQLGENDFAVNLTNPEDVKSFVGQLRASYKSIGGIIHLLPLRDKPNWEINKAESWPRYLNEEVKSFYHILKACAGDLKNGQPKWVIGCTKLGGESNNGNYPVPDYPWRGGIAGIIKTVGLEWPDAVCKLIDTDKGTSTQELVLRILAEAAMGNTEKEVYYRNSARLLAKAWQAPLRKNNGGCIKINRDDVILVTGGARGITAEVTLEMARLYQPTIILAGRSAWPQEESQDTTHITDSVKLKESLIQMMSKEGRKITPMEVETAYKRIIADRQMRATKHALEEAGAKVFYYQVDVRDDTAFGSLIDNIYKTYGRLDGVISGAGIIEDKLLEDKDPESFNRVFDTKTQSALTLSIHLKPETLKFLVFFSSIAGSFGNRGQSDYSAANEVLNRLAMYLDAHWPARVVAINWGPWEKVGMANPVLQNQFIERGIVPISPHDGSKAFIDELFYGEHGQAVVVIGSGPWVGKEQ